MAGTHVVTSRVFNEIAKGGRSRRVEVVTTTWVADSAAATIPDLSIPLAGYCLKVITNPGTTAPTDNWDITLGDPEDSTLDAAASLLLNRHTTTTQQVYPLISGGAVPIFLSGTYTLSVSGNSVNSATARIIFYLVDEL